MEEPFSEQESEEVEPSPFDKGIQPLDELMLRLGLTNADLVKSSTRGLTFKMVQKGRKGRRLTSNVKGKILSALKALKPDQTFTLPELFNY